MSQNAEWAQRANRVLVGNYAQQPIAIERGEGCTLFDAEGREYLDLMGGIATAVLGHCHPRIVAALEKQSHRLWHASNLFFTEPQVELAEKLIEHSFADRAFFCNSGGEANEAALKLARRFQRDRGEDRFEIIAFEGGFHGRTLFTVSATGQPAYWKGFEPLVPGIHFAPFGDLDAVKALLSPRTAAIIVEPIQGEGGVWPAPAGFLEGLRELADESRALLIFDEVQSGMGRTGKLFAHQHSDVTPDLMTLAKALGNGIPIGALCAAEPYSGALVPGTHASTFGGNPLATACAAVVMDELTTGGLLARSQAAGAHLAKGLAVIAKQSPGQVVETRGLGLLQALELTGPAAPVIARCRELGVLVISAGANVIRFAPPLIIETEQIDAGLETVTQALAEAGPSR